MSDAIRAAGPGRRPSLAPVGIPVITAVLGIALAAVLGVIFAGLHENWTQLPGVDHSATSTVPYWTVQYSTPLLVSVCWAALFLHARQVPRWAAWAAGALALELTLLVAGLLPIALAGNGGVAVGTIPSLLLLLAYVAVPVTAAFLPRGRGRVLVGSHFAAALTFAAALWLGLNLWAPQTLLI